LLTNYIFIFICVTI